MARILVVDDEVNVTDLMRVLLERAGHSVETASNGRDALRLLGVEPLDETAPLPELVVLDVMMPHLDGITVFRRLRDNPRTAKLKIVILTAKNQTKALFAELAADGFIQKPFDPGAARAALLSLLEKKS